MVLLVDPFSWEQFLFPFRDFLELRGGSYNQNQYFPSGFYSG